MRFGQFLAFAAMATAICGPAHAERGSDGQVNLILWQAPSIMNPYLSGGVKDIEVASFVLEPLARFNPDGEITPWLVDTIPTIENGGISDDLMSVTWTLSEDVLWSNGDPVTSEDIKFTWSYCTAEGAGCAQREKFAGIADIDTPDTRTAVIRFAEPKPFPYAAFVGAQSPLLNASQFKDCVGAQAPSCTQENFRPIGTGPFVVDEFRPNDTILFSANPNYRADDKPAFSSLVVKGGGTAEGAARAVLQTGDYDYAWNLQLPPEVLQGMEQSGAGQVVSVFGTLIERVVVNLTNPAAELGPDRSTRAHPHPFLAHKEVREALSKAIDRAILVEIGYGETGRLTCDLVPAPQLYVSGANDACKVQDIAGANALLDAAGWIDSDGDGIRDKDGVDLRLVFQTSSNAVRQTFQAAIKSWWSEIGVATELRDIDANIFFGSDAGSPDTFQKFFADVQMYAQSYDGTDPEAYLSQWQCDRVPGPDNQWQATNVPRYCNPAYDVLVEELRGTAGLEARAALSKTINDMLVQDFVMLPLVYRGRVSAHALTLGGVKMNAWDSEFWNAADWYRDEAG